VGVMYLGRLVELAPRGELFGAPRHPYTRMLLAAVPDARGTRRERAPVQGEVSDPLAPPPGCAFHPRCPHANERCRVERPELRDSGGMRVACHAVEEGRLRGYLAAAGRAGELAPSSGAGGVAGRVPSGALGSRATGVAAVPARDGRYSGPFWPHAASASTSAAVHTAKTPPRAGRWCSARLDPWLPFIPRILSTMSAPTLQDTEYQAAAERVLAAIERQCDAWLQQGVIDIDTGRAGGLVELEFPDGSKIVVNKQPPLHEIWLAARNGGFHFRFTDEGWRDTRDGVDFFARLSDEASRQAGVALAFTA